MLRSSGVIGDHALSLHRRLAFQRLLEHDAHVGEQVLANHAQEIEAGRASRLFKIGACPAAKFQHAKFGVNGHPAWAQAPKQDPVAGLAHVGRIRRKRRCPVRLDARVQSKRTGPLNDRSGAPRVLLRENLLFRVDRFEKIVERTSSPRTGRGPGSRRDSAHSATWVALSFAVPHRNR